MSTNSAKQNNTDDSILYVVENRSAREGESASSGGIRSDDGELRKQYKYKAKLDDYLKTEEAAARYRKIRGLSDKPITQVTPKPTAKQVLAPQQQFDSRSLAKVRSAARVVMNSSIAQAAKDEFEYECTLKVRRGVNYLLHKYVFPWADRKIKEIFFDEEPITVHGEEVPTKEDVTVENPVTPDTASESPTVDSRHIRIVRDEKVS